MHRITSQPGGYNPDTTGVIVIEQTPGDLVFLTAADTDIQSLAQAISHQAADFPTIRVVNLLNLQQPFSLDDYTERVLSRAKAIVVRLLGGRSYWPYGVEVLLELAARSPIQVWFLPADEQSDPQLMGHSSVPWLQVQRLWHYCNEGGLENWCHALQWLSDCACGTNYDPPPPQAIPPWGHYQPPLEIETTQPPTLAKVAILFYRAYYLAGNLQTINALAQTLQQRGCQPSCFYVTSLREPDLQTHLQKQLRAQNCRLIINTTSFSLAQLQRQVSIDPHPIPLWQALNVPVFQVILSSGTSQDWQAGQRGLSPRDVAMNVALPEVDGRIITRAVAFKAQQSYQNQLQTDVIFSEPQADRLAWLGDLVQKTLICSQTAVAERKIALILANYPNKDGRLANGVGLDTPASCLEVLKALQREGYHITDLPPSPQELITRLTAGITNDLEQREHRLVQQSLKLEQLWAYFQSLPTVVQAQLKERWQEREGWDSFPPEIPIAGLQLGHVFVGIQPSRGYDLDPSLNYHAPDLEPTLAYLAFYEWLRSVFKAQAFVHLGKHGNLEWLPGKSLALSSTCYPEIALGPWPHFYPFIVNDPGEGTQAKRRAQAVIIDHLTPPLTRAELYGDLEKLEALIDEYYEAQSLDPSRLSVIGDRLEQLIKTTRLDRDLGLELAELKVSPRSRQSRQYLEQIISGADSYLCELKEAQIRDGLHILGLCPQGLQLRDLLIAIARSPQGQQPGLTQAIALDLGLDFDPILDDWQEPFSLTDTTEKLLLELGLPELIASLQKCRHGGEVVAILETLAQQFLDSPLPLPWGLPWQETSPVLSWIGEVLLPLLHQSEQEIVNLMRGLGGEYIASGASGAPTRGRPDVLPTGRNFYGVDIRAIPTETAWQVGCKAAEALIERYTQEKGEYPQRLALSIWGTATMRTGGDDVAQVLALLGVQPLWDGPSRRVVDFEILPVAVLGRPRVDVTVRISGFFRDSFPNLIELLQEAIAAVSQLPETAAENPLQAKVQAETAQWQAQGLEREAARQQAQYRIFGSKPGAYGAGLQGLIESQNWQDDQDLAQAYLNWSCYAYDSQGVGHNLPLVLQERLKNVDIVLHNQDNREHDLLDSDDYYQFQGGLTAAVRALSGTNPTLYFGDHAIPQRPKIKTLPEEINRVYRSRVVNPKWIAGVMRHGYKGAFEMAATVDYLFAYAATTHCVEAHLWQGVAEAYLLDPAVQNFVQQNNPWALRDMAERLLEAQQRGLWAQPPSQLVEELRAIAHGAEAVIEAQSF